MATIEETIKALEITQKIAKLFQSKARDKLGALVEAKHKEDKDWAKGEFYKGLNAGIQTYDPDINSVDIEKLLEAFYGKNDVTDSRPC